MNIFISFSGSSSKAAAEHVHEWLLNVFQNINVWMSAHDLGAGTLWSGELHRRLKEADFGILCLTEENQVAPWILYEAGCLVMSVEAGRVVPLLIDLQIGQLKYPLCQLQSVTANEDGLRRLVESLNKANPSPLAPDRLAKTFDKWWPELREKLEPKFSLHREGQVTTVTPFTKKYLEDGQCQQLGQQLRAIIERDAGAIILNCQNIEYVSSTWLGTVLGCFKTACRTRCAFLLANLSDVIREHLATLNLDKILPISLSLDEALELALLKIDESASEKK